MMKNPYPNRSLEYRAWDAGYHAGRSDNADREWRTVEIAPEYEISSFGELRRTSTKDGRPPRAIQGQIDKGGYRKYWLRAGDGANKVVPAHRLVCLAFVGARPSKDHFVAHGDGNRLNNHFGNLRWATRRENEADKVSHGTRPIGERHGKAKLTEAQARAILESTGHARDIGGSFGVSQWAVRDIRNGRCWKHLGQKVEA